MDNTDSATINNATNIGSTTGGDSFPLAAAAEQPAPAIQQPVSQPVMQLESEQKVVQPVAELPPQPVVQQQPVPAVEETKPVGPSLFGYKPPSWANDYEYIRLNRGKGLAKDSGTWALMVFDRLLKKHS